MFLFVCCTLGNVSCAYYLCEYVIHDWYILMYYTCGETPTKLTMTYTVFPHQPLYCQCPIKIRQGLDCN